MIIIWSDIAKLIPMLSSKNPHEVSGTVAAIERKLNARGLAWHDLAERVAGSDRVTLKPAAQPHAWGFATRAPNGNIRAEATIIENKKFTTVFDLDDFGRMEIPLNAIATAKVIGRHRVSIEIKQTWAREKGLCE